MVGHQPRPVHCINLVFLHDIWVLNKKKHNLHSKLSKKLLECLNQFNMYVIFFGIDFLVDLCFDKFHQYLHNVFHSHRVEILLCTLKDEKIPGCPNKRVFDIFVRF